jgi:hypothetical protein
MTHSTERPWRCPTCDSPQPSMHPAVSGGGEAIPCRDPWHDDARPVAKQETR